MILARRRSWIALQSAVRKACITNFEEELLFSSLYTLPSACPPVFSPRAYHLALPCFKVVIALLKTRLSLST